MPAARLSFTPSATPFFEANAFLFFLQLKFPLFIPSVTIKRSLSAHLTPLRHASFLHVDPRCLPRLPPQRQSRRTAGRGPGPGRWRGRRSLGPSPAAPLTGISGASCPRRVGISPRPGPLEQTPRGDPAGPRKRVATDPHGPASGAQRAPPPP